MDHRIFAAFVIVVVAASCISSLDAYKLNVPKVLLPFHSSKLISFVLEVKTEGDQSSGASSATEELCFDWSTSRPDIVTITPLYDTSSTKCSPQDETSSNSLYGDVPEREGGGSGRTECSRKAIVTAVSKHAQRLTSIILAKETKTDKIIRCDVIVDQIANIRIKHTTTHLYLEDSPECFTVEALDTEGNTFTSIDGLAFEWSIIHDQQKHLKDSSDDNQSRNVLRIGKLIDSEYELSESIRALEAVGLSGHKMLIEGLRTGTASVQSKLLDPFYKDALRTPQVRLLVVANIMLEPSYPVFVLIGAIVKYNVFLIKQTSVEKITLPSQQYYFESRNTTVADLVEKSNSVVMGLELGSTELVLVDRNMGEEFKMSIEGKTDPNMYVPPPTAQLHVVSPGYLVFTIKNWRSSWILEVGRTYEISIHVYSSNKEMVHVSENLFIDSQFDVTKFHLDSQSQNGSYHVVKVLEKGMTKALALLKGTLLGNDLKPFKLVARGEQDIELLDPIEVKPPVLIFAWAPHTLSTGSIGGNNSNTVPTVGYYEYQLEATGGSGSYYWQSRNTSVATINSQGLLKRTASRLGQTMVLVTDTRNIDIQAKALVYVLEPVDLSLQACPVETQVGKRLYLNIQMNTYVNTGDLSQSLPSSTWSSQPGGQERLMAINDCSRLQFDVNIFDPTVFRLVSIESPSTLAASVKDHPIQDACAVVVLESLKVGRTLIKVRANSYSQSEINTQLQSNELHIGSYSALKSFKSEITLAKDSSFIVTLYDGPLYSSLAVASGKQSETSKSLVGSGYESHTEISHSNLVQVSSIESDYQLNRYSYRIKCLDVLDSSDNLVKVKFYLSHKKASFNKCPVRFDHEVSVRCSRPHSLELAQLFVRNEESNQPIYSNLKWKCPIKLSSNLIVANLDRHLYVQLIVRDKSNNIFDNFTSHQIEWQIEKKNMIALASSKLHYLVMTGNSNDENSLRILPDQFDELNTHLAYFQAFNTRSKLGDCKLTATLALSTHKSSEAGGSSEHLSRTLNIHFVSDAKIQPDQLTIFNHPSNLISLSISRGSGYYHAEIETIKAISPALAENQLNQDSNVPQQAASVLGNVLKISQITENSVAVTPALNNGLVYLHIFDYCVPPIKLDLIESQYSKPHAQKQGFSQLESLIYSWQPSTTAKVHVAGINSILVGFDDDKLQVNSQINIYVQISDANGNLIKTKYFSLMNLVAKLVNADSTTKSVKGNEQIMTATELAQIEPATSQATTFLNDQDREYTAVYVLNAIKPGLVSIQFEANSDGYLDRVYSGSNTKKSLIKSQLKEVQIYLPLQAQPKYIELVKDAYYQVTLTGGPNSPDASIKYETQLVARKSSDKVIDIDTALGVVKGLDLGEVKVIVKSVGTACLPFSSVSSSIDISSGVSLNEAVRCQPENRVQRVYSEDHFVVKVVDLRSVHIHTPIRSIKKGNEMPIYLMANDRTLSPLNFASSPHLKYFWRVNDHQVGSLQHPLLHSSKQDTTSDSSSFDEGNDSVLESAYSLRFSARQSGLVKVSVRVEYHGHGSRTPQVFTDSVDILVFDNPYFTHFPVPYFLFKYPHLKSCQSNRLGTDSLEQHPSNEILMTPGTQFQVKTNYDKVAAKIMYKLKMYDQFSNEPEKSSLVKAHCNNNTITVSPSGLITVARLKHNQLKYLQECSANLLVTILISEQSSSSQSSSSSSSSSSSASSSSASSTSNIKYKQQSLSFTIKVKSVAYTMLKLKRHSMLKLNDQLINNNKVRVDKRELIQSKLSLSSTDLVQMRWRVAYYDSLGDQFDIVQANSIYTLNRNDLISYSQLNGNLFSFAPVLTTSSASYTSGFEFDHNHDALSLLANSVENTFLLKTNGKAGRFVMELTPAWSVCGSPVDARDYVALNIFEEKRDQAQVAQSSYDLLNNYHVKLEAQVGDFVCLSNQRVEDLGDEDESEDERMSYSSNADRITTWVSQSGNVVRMVNTGRMPYSHFGLCVNEGHTMVKSIQPLDESILKILEIDVKPIKRVKFLTKSFKHITNSESQSLLNNDLNSQQQSSTSQLIPFQIDTSSSLLLPNSNCSDQFESYLQSLPHQQQHHELIPFRCSASLFTKSGHRLAYLDRLILTSVTYANQHWSCVIRFVPNSASLIYTLIDANVDRSVDTSQDKFGDENEPTSIKVTVDSKLSEYDSAKEDQSRQLSGLFSFAPAFNVQTKQIELPIIRSRTRRSGESTSGGDHFNLIIQATHQLQPHLVLSTNCPSLIRIQPLLIQGKPSTTNSDQASLPFTILYDVVTAEEDTFDLNTYSNLMQMNQGKLYVQIACSLTQQIERIPIRFLFGSPGGQSTIDLLTKPSGSSTSSRLSSAVYYTLIGWIFDLSPSQITSFLIAVSVVLMTILFLLKLKSPTSIYLSPTTAEQIAMNASAAAAAVVAANNYNRSPTSGVKEYSSFNPYRYFGGANDASVNDISMKQRCHNVSATAGGFSPKLSPSQQRLQADYSINQNRSVFGASPSPQVRLFSTDANVSPTTTLRYAERRYRSFRNDSYSENE